MNCILEAWDSHHLELLRFVASRISDSQEAHNLVQEVLLRATRLDNGLCGVGNRRAWLFHVARNLLIDRYRLAKDEIPLEDELELAEGTEEVWSWSSASSETRDLAGFFHAGLPPSRRFSSSQK